MSLLMRTLCAMGGVLVLLSSMALAAGPTGEGEPAEPEAASTGSADSRIVLYYFHGERRCRTCRTIESYAEETVQTRFGKQLRSGTLEWKAVNIDEPQNEHFVQDFALPSSSLVVAEVTEKGVVRHEILQDVWVLVRDRSEFESYVVHALRRYLG
jgi:hypothetical protein